METTMRWFSPSSRQTRFTSQNRLPRFDGERRRDRVRRSAGGWTLILCLTRLGLAAAAEPATIAAENVLRHVKGVANIPGGKVWLCGAERTLRTCLTSLGDSRRDLVTQQRLLDQRIQQNAQAWEANRQQITALKTALSSTPTGAPERKPIEQQIRRLEKQAVDPDRLAAQSDVRTHLIQFTNARNAMAVKLLTIRRSVPRMEADYRSLEADLEVRAALRTLGEGHRLGPLENYLPELRRLDEYERLVFTSWLPMYLQSGRIRAGAILNETTPITFSWHAEGGPTILTESMVEAAGLALPAPATAVSLPLESGRTLTARPLIVPSLRLGQFVLRDVPVHVSGPDGEDVGAILSANVLEGYEVKVEPARLQLTIRPR
jgi:hypothetical protein